MIHHYFSEPDEWEKDAERCHMGGLPRPRLGGQGTDENREMKLKDIAEIQIGYQHRDKGHPINMSSTGTHRIIQKICFCRT